MASAACSRIYSPNLPFQLLTRSLHPNSSPLSLALHARHHSFNPHESPKPHVSHHGSRKYATQTSLGTTRQPAGRRKPVTIFNDDGHIPWGQLSPAEKAARTAQQSVNLTLVIGGAILTAAVFTFMYTDVFSTQSSTAQFNRAVDSIRKDSRVTALLGDGGEIRAYGEASWNKWRRNRPIASRTETDKFGTERLYMHFNVEGPRGAGVARLFMVRRQDEKQFNYGSLVVDVPGQSRITVESGDAEKKGKAAAGRFLGIKWS